MYGKYVGADEEGNLYKVIVGFVIIGLNVQFLILFNPFQKSQFLENGYQKNFLITLTI